MPGRRVARRISAAPQPGLSPSIAYSSERPSGRDYDSTHEAVRRMIGNAGPGSRDAASGAVRAWGWQTAGDRTSGTGIAWITSKAKESNVTDLKAVSGYQETLSD